MIEIRHDAVPRPAPGTRFRRAPVPRDDSPLLVDARPAAAVAHRGRRFRTAVVTADIFGSLLVVGLLLAWLPARELSWTALLLPALVPLVHAANGLYLRDARVINKSTLDEAPVLFRAATMTTVVGYLLQSGILVIPIGAKVVGSVWLGLTLCIPSCRAMARGIARRLLPPERCLVVGDNHQGRRLAAQLRSTAGVKSELVGVVPIAPRAAKNGGDLLSNLAAQVDRLDVHRVVVAADAAEPQQELEAIQAAKALGVEGSVLPRVLEVLGSSATYDFVDGLTILGVPRFGLSRSAVILKRTFDAVGSLVLLTLLAPLLLALA